MHHSEAEKICHSFHFIADRQGSLKNLKKTQNETSAQRAYKNYTISEKSITEPLTFRTFPLYKIFYIVGKGSLNC